MISLVSLVNKSWSDKEYHSLLPLASWALIAWSFEVLHVISPALRLQVVHCKFCFVDRRWLYGEKLRSNSPSAGKFSRLTINSDSNQIWPITMHLNTVMNQSHLALQPSKRGEKSRTKFTCAVTSDWQQNQYVCRHWLDHGPRAFCPVTEQLCQRQKK